MQRPLALLSHPVSIFGVALTTASALFFLFLFLLGSLGYFTNPYLGLLVFVALPALFVTGLLLIPIGAALGRRRGRTEATERPWPRIDLNEPWQRRVVGLFALGTVVNLVILAMGTSGGMAYMESPDFCGQVCHAVMEPQFVSHQVSPHARVACAACHVGGNATSFVTAKLRGTRQLLQVVTDSYDRPVHLPTSGLRPARETCEQCHWPEKFHGDRLREFREYANDEPSSELVTRLRVHVGGGSERLGVATGIHWHMNLANRVEYVALDEAGQDIPWVRLTARDGTVREFVTEGFTPAQLDQGERRVMDCMDCHNRVAHGFFASPERAVDQAIAVGRISRDLPFIRREAVAALGEAGPSAPDRVAAAGEHLRTVYARGYPDLPAEQQERLEQAIRAVRDLERENLFPRMQVAWGTYPSAIGHVDAPGCFRCHDDGHRASDGSVIRQDCELCHSFE